MPAYEICYLNNEGTLTYKFAADCIDDGRAKVLAHAMKLPSAKRLEVWSGEILIYARPSDCTSRCANRFCAGPVGAAAWPRKVGRRSFPSGRATSV